MSLAGSIASMTGRRRIAGGQRHLDDDPGHRRILVQLADGAPASAGLGSARRPVALDLDEPAVDADASRRPCRIWLEVDRRGRVAAARATIASVGRVAVPARRRPRRRPRPSARISRGDRRALEQASRPSPAATLVTRRDRSGDGQRVARSPERRPPGSARARSATSVEQVVDRAAASRGERLVGDRREVDEDVCRRPAGCGLAEQRGDGQVARGVDVAPTGQRLGRADDARGRPRRTASGTSAATRAAARMAQPTAPPARRRCRGAASSPRANPA